jgi:hypothetical protein
VGLRPNEENDLAIHVATFVENDLLEEGGKLSAIIDAADKLSSAIANESDEEHFLKEVTREVCEKVKVMHAKCKTLKMSTKEIIVAVGKNSAAFDLIDEKLGRSTALTVTWALLTLLHRLKNKTDEAKSAASLKKIIEDNFATPELTPYTSDYVLEKVRLAISGKQVQTPILEPTQSNAVEANAVESAGMATVDAPALASGSKPKQGPEKVAAKNGRGGRGGRAGGRGGKK